MIDSSLRVHLRNLLERDRVWAAYALADLDPRVEEHSQWLSNDSGVVLIYHGLDPAILFAQGDPKDVRQLLDQVPPGRYIYQLMGTYKALLAERLGVEHEEHMWRMVLNTDEFPGVPAGRVDPLTTQDLPQIEALFADHPDRPDAFHPNQLIEGPFYGIWEHGDLIAVSGTHVVSKWANVAAVGNVFTHPRHRGRGLGTRVSAALVQHLLDDGIHTIVLNVAMDNEPALRCYQKLAFLPFCGYYEGVGRLAPVQESSAGEDIIE
ncbi:MAG: GNAT family N-acetyltransferase [Anaerolineales bacterium]|nr:GNAT family N-acetyltransferase [Anaerolineales bacterium]